MNELYLSPDEVTAERIAERFERWGCCVLRGLFQAGQLEGVRRQLGALIDLVSGEPAASGPALQRLAHLPPEQIEAVFAGARRLTSVHQLSVHPRLLEVSEALMGSDLLMCPPYKPVRMDFAAREQRLLPWHQDYPYAQDSVDGVVYWIPLQDVDERNGCLQVAPGSHCLGVVPVEMIEPPADQPCGTRGIRIAEPIVAERFPQPRVPMQEGDVLVLSALLLHRSCVNYSGSVRFTVQVRHGNFRDPQAVQKHWPRGHFERHWFDQTHPEFVVKREG